MLSSSFLPLKFTKLRNNTPIINNRGEWTIVKIMVQKMFFKALFLNHQNVKTKVNAFRAQQNDFSLVGHFIVVCLVI